VSLPYGSTHSKLREQWACRSTRLGLCRNGQNQPSVEPEPHLDLEIVTITPDPAQDWLDRGGTNRKITRRHIEAMTAAIRRGEWQLTGEAIKLDGEGRVRNGQNRLHAIVEAGILVSRLPSVLAYAAAPAALTGSAARIRW
jgi:hypothetical protein